MCTRTRTYRRHTANRPSITATERRRTARRTSPHRESCARSALGLGYDSKFSLPCGVLMAGYAAGFSGLESFSPSSFSHSGLSLSIPSLARSVFLPLFLSFSFFHRLVERRGKSGRGNRETERETSCSRFFAVRKMCSTSSGSL